MTGGGGRQGLALVVSGPAGVGKSTVCGKLLEEDGFVLSVSATTRAPRGGEVHGKDYLFLSVEEFEAMREAGELLEWAQVHRRHYYGTPAGPVLENLAAGRHVLMDIDVQGADQLRQKGLGVATVFIEPPSFEVLEERLTGRGDTPPAEIERRLLTAREELKQAWRYDLRVVNDEVERAVNAIREFLAGRVAP